MKCYHRYLQQSGRLDIIVENADMAMFCAQYLSSKPFSPELDELEIREYVCSGYYGFLDYAMANWWKHAKRMAGDCNTSPNLRAFQSISEFLKSLEGSSTAIDGDPTTEDTKTLQQRITDLPNEDRGLEGTFSLEGVIHRVRTAIEGMLDNDLRIPGGAIELYGHFSYKCSKPWCHCFTQGFETSTKRKNHVSEHERPFRCNIDGCFGQEIGFSRQSVLKKHNSSLHDQATETTFPLFPTNKATNLDMSIIQAAAKGHLASVQSCLEAGVDINVVNPRTQNDFPLFVAAKNGHFDVCRYLLDKGADVDAQCEKTGKTALEAAVRKDQVEIMRLLIDAGANTRLRNKDRKTAIVIAVTRKNNAVISTFPAEDLEHRVCKWLHCFFVKSLLLPRNSENKPDTLSEAILQNDIDNAKIFINRGCEDLNLDLGNGKVTFPLHIAIRTGQDEITQTLLFSGRVDINRLDYTGSLPLHHACVVGNEALTRQLLPGTHDPDRRDAAGYTPFHLAIKLSQSVTIAAILLSSGAINLFNESKEKVTIAMEATAATPELMDLIFRTEPLALSRPSSDGVTPLHAAAYNMRLDMVEYILSKGDADTNESYRKVPPSWASLPVYGLELETSRMLRTPLFLAMMAYDPYNSRNLRVVHSITKAVLSSKTVVLSESLGERDQAIVADLIRGCCNGEVVTDLVDAGLSYLPWMVCTWANNVYASIVGIGQTPEITLTHDVVLKVICRGRCRFLDVAKENFALARAIWDQEKRFQAGLFNGNNADEVHGPSP